MKSTKSLLYGLAIIAIVASVGIVYKVYAAYSNNQPVEPGQALEKVQNQNNATSTVEELFNGPLDKEKYLGFQGNMYNLMEANGANAGTMMFGNQMTKTKYLEVHEQIYDMMAENGIHPRFSMGQCLGPTVMMGSMSTFMPQMETSTQNESAPESQPQMEGLMPLEEQPKPGSPAPEKQQTPTQPQSPVIPPNPMGQGQNQTMDPNMKQDAPPLQDLLKEMEEQGRPRT